MKRAVIMCRVSSDEQAKGYSLDIQNESLTKYCQSNNIQVVKHYREDHSAKDFNRPEFKKFMDFAKKNKGQVDLLLITSWDRFSRNLTDALIVLRKLERLGIEVQAIQQPLDMSIPENKAMLAMFLAMPEIDNDRRSIKVKEGMRACLKAGRWGRKAPKGYRNSRDVDNKPLIVPNDDAHLIEHLFKLVSKGVSQSDAWREVQQMGLKVSKNNIGLMLRNPVYMGKIVVPACKDEKKVLIEGVHDGVVDEGLFNEVQEIIDGKKNTIAYPSRITQKEELYLRGLLSCAKCGKMITGSASRSRNKSRYFYYHCNYCKGQRYRADQANNTMQNIMGLFSFNKDAKVLYEEMMRMSLQGSKGTKESNIAKFEKEISQVDEKLEKLQDLLMDDKLSIENFNKMSDRYTTDRLQKVTKLNQLREQNTDFEKWLEEGVNFISDIAKSFKESTIDGKQRIIGSIFPEKIEFENNQCRTARMNEVIAKVLIIDKGSRVIKKGQINKFIDLSYWVGPPGLEPGTF